MIFTEVFLSYLLANRPRFLNVKLEQFAAGVTFINSLAVVASTNMTSDCFY